jgi:uncharacterized ParB-like nuclease family protein
MVNDQSKVFNILNTEKGSTQPSSSSLGTNAKYFKDKPVNAGKFREFGNTGLGISHKNALNI